MTLKERREQIILLLQRNKSDIIYREQNLEGLRNGTIHLKAQLLLLDELIKDQEVEEKANEKVSSDVHPPAVAPATSAPVRSEHTDTANPGPDGGSGNGS